MCAIIIYFLARITLYEGKVGRNALLQIRHTTTTNASHSVAKI